MKTPAIGSKHPTGCGGEAEVIAIEPKLGEAPIVAIVRFPGGAARVHQYREDGSYYGRVHPYMYWGVAVDSAFGNLAREEQP